MLGRKPLVFALGALLGSTALIPLLAQTSTPVLADPAAATVPDASTIKPAPTPAQGETVNGKTSEDKISATKSTGAKPAADDNAASAATTKDVEAQRRAQRKADREAFFSAHLAALHAGLALQPDQEALWQPVENAIRDLAKARAARWKMRHPHRADQDDRAIGTMNAGDNGSDSVDQLLAHGETLTRMGNAIQGLARATSPLLASLTPEQKGRLPMLVQGLKPRRLIARAFNLDDETMRPGAMEGRHRDGYGGGDGQARDNGFGDDGFADHHPGEHGFGLRFNEDGRGDFAPGGRHPYEQDGDAFQGNAYGRSGAMNDQRRFMPGDASDQ